MFFFFSFFSFHFLEQSYKGLTRKIEGKNIGKWYTEVKHNEGD